MKTLPEGCHKHVDYDCVMRKDIHRDRPHDQCNISTECTIGGGYHFEKRGWFVSYWVVFTTITYEMSGQYANGRYMGGRAWAETDHSGIEWHFKDEALADKFFYKSVLEDNE